MCNRQHSKIDPREMKRIKNKISNYRYLLFHSQLPEISFSCQKNIQYTLIIPTFTIFFFFVVIILLKLMLQAILSIILNKLQKKN